MKITPRTVAFHKYSMMHELGITSSLGWCSTQSSSAWSPSSQAPIVFPVRTCHFCQ